MSKPSRDPSVNQEPHLRGKGYQSDSSEARVERARPGRDSEDQRVEHSVWDEPGVSPDVAGPPPDGELTYRAWLQKRRDETSAEASWGITFAVAALAGPLAIAGALWGSGQTALSLLAVVVFGPLVEEMVKVAIPLYLVEKRPFLFVSRVQIGVCAVAGGLAFAAIENLLYLNVYVPEPSEELIRWRWTVCVALHTTCSFVLGLGLMRIWGDTWQRMARPRVGLGYPFFLAGIVLHGAYNGFAVIYSLTGDRF